jgi:hypothetical protein
MAVYARAIRREHVDDLSVTVIDDVKDVEFGCLPVQELRENPVTVEKAIGV